MLPTNGEGYRIAVVGATGNVGREMLSILAEREFPASEVFAIASRRSQGTELSYGDRTLKCKDLEQFDFRGIDFVLMSAGSEVSKAWSPRIGAMGAVVIDNSSAWRYESDVPLIVPEVNAHVLEDYMSRRDRRNIIANPNCSTAQLVVVLRQRPEQRNEEDGRQSADDIHRHADLHEVGEAVAAGAVDHGVGLITDGRGEAR
jgi:aspartate-semialdehyde dehydrogenase